MESQQPPVVGQRVVGTHPEHFARREKHHCGIGEVIVAPPAAGASVGTLGYEHDGIELELYRPVPDALPPEVDNRRLWVQRLGAEAVVALAHSVQVEGHFVRFHLAHND